MAKFQYEWWTVSIKYQTGTYTCEFKGKNKESVIRQIKKEAKTAYAPSVVEVYWKTLKLDRIGYKREY